MARRRRTRFNFTAVKDGEFAPRKVSVLSPDLASAVERLCDLGWSDIEHVEKPKASERSWEISEAAVNEAKKLLGIEWPVHITVKHSEAHMGVCRTHFRKHEHRITLRPMLGVEKASIVLWHELGHAAYDERVTQRYGDATTAVAMMKQEKRRFSYENRPCENFARTCEHHHFDHFPLTRGAS